MNAQDLNNILVFLKRAQLTGEEAEVMVELKRKIQALLTPVKPETKPEPPEEKTEAKPSE